MVAEAYVPVISLLKQTNLASVLGLQSCLVTKLQKKFSPGLEPTVFSML